MAAYWASGSQLTSDQNLPPNDLIDPDTGSIDYSAASWSAASWSTAADPLAASWSAASWSCLDCSSAGGNSVSPTSRELERRRLGQQVEVNMSVTGSIANLDRDSRLRSLLASVLRSRPYRLSSGQAAIWALSGGMIATAAVLFQPARGTCRRSSPRSPCRSGRC